MPSDLMLDISYSRHLIQSDLRKRRNKLDLYHHVSHTTILLDTESRSSTYTLLHHLHILLTNTHPPRPTKMPARLSTQILNHDTGQHHHLRVNGVENRVIGEIETVGYVGGYPCCFRVRF